MQNGSKIFVVRNLKETKLEEAREKDINIGTYVQPTFCY